MAASIRDTIARIAAEEGIDPGYALAVAERESGFRPEAGGTGTIRGMFQMTGAIRRQYGIPENADVETQVRGFARYTHDLRADMATRLGREPTNEETYLGHHFGPGRGAATAAGAYNGMHPGQVFTPREMAGNPHFARAGTMDNLNNSIQTDMARRYAKHTGGTLPPGTQMAAGSAPDFSEFGQAVEQHPLTGKPILNNPDGSISTEQTITVEMDGRHYNIPTIVNGRRVSPDQAIALMRSGQNKPVGVFGSAQEAETAARERSNQLGAKPVNVAAISPGEMRKSTDPAALTAGDEPQPEKPDLKANSRPGSEIDLSGFGQTVAEKNEGSLPDATTVSSFAPAEPERAGLQVRAPSIPPIPSSGESNRPEPTGLGVQLGAFQQPNPYYPDVAVGGTW